MFHPHLSPDPRRKDSRGRFARLARPLLTTVVGTLIGGAAYTLWLSSFLLFGATETGPRRTLLLLLAPLMTACGFAAGRALVERPWEDGGGTLPALFLPPLAGCLLGALVAVQFGPMLIVVGMLGGGAVAVGVASLRS